MSVRGYNNSYYRCAICRERRFPTREDLRKHIKGDKSSFAAQYSPSNHSGCAEDVTLWEWAPSGQQGKCPTCSQQFENSDQLGDHALDCHSGPVRSQTY